MALRVGCGDGRARALFVLGFPLSMVPDTAFLDACRQPRLFVQGENDEFGSGPAVQALVERLPQPKSLVIIPGSDHFFAGHSTRSEAVRAWAVHAVGAAANDPDSPGASNER